MAYQTIKMNNDENTGRKVRIEETVLVNAEKYSTDKWILSDSLQVGDRLHLEDREWEVVQVDEVVGKEVYKVYDEEKDKAKTFRSFEQADSFLDVIQSSYAYVYCLKITEVDAEQMVLELFDSYEKETQQTSGYFLKGKRYASTGKYGWSWFTDNGVESGVEYSTLNGAFKGAMKNWNLAIHQAESDWIRGMEEAHFGTRECSTCRGGGCIHCEPNRFL